MSRQAGFSLVGLMIVITIIGILIGLILTASLQARSKAHDNSVRNDIRQMRWLAEEVYDTQGARYWDWSQHSAITAELTLLLRDVDSILGDDPNDGTYLTVIRETQAKEYCISAPLKSNNEFYCVDATGVFTTTSEHCPNFDEEGPPLRCP